MMKYKSSGRGEDLSLRRRYWLAITMCMVSWFLPPHDRHIAHATDAEQTQTSAYGKEPSADITVSDWFSKYDQIRRDAEMSLGEKLQSLALNQSLKPSGKSATLVAHMISKYSQAATEMKDLPSLPETRELQEGYVQYFTTAIKLFESYLDQSDARDKQSVDARNKSLEELDKKNKKLDAALRKRFSIAKHKHT